jgi:hypothetical protein
MKCDAASIPLFCEAPEFCFGFAPDICHVAERALSATKPLDFYHIIPGGGKVGMIVVVEGISAAGKMTWCRQHAAQYLIKESYPENRPDRHADAVEAARLWTGWNAKRWTDAVAMEHVKGVAVCDTDPLKLHFSWALWQNSPPSQGAVRPPIDSAIDRAPKIHSVDQPRPAAMSGARMLKLYTGCRS